MDERAARRRAGGRETGGLGGVDAGDLVIVREADDEELPAGVIMAPGSVQPSAAGRVHVRFCNVQGSASAADGSIAIRWLAFNP